MHCLIFYLVMANVLDLSTLNSASQEAEIYSSESFRNKQTLLSDASVL